MVEKPRKARTEKTVARIDSQFSEKCPSKTSEECNFYSLLAFKRKKYGKYCEKTEYDEFMAVCNTYCRFASKQMRTYHLK